MRKMISILSSSHLALEPMLLLRAENKKVEIGTLVKIKRSLFDLIEDQIGVVTEVEGNKVTMHMIGHYRPVIIPDVRDWLDIIEVFDNE